MGIDKAEWWVFDLVRLAGQEDRQTIGQELGWPSTANGFRKTLGESSETETETYSSTELAAMKAAIEWMRVELPESFAAVSAYMRKGQDGGLQLAQAMVILGQKVDEIVDGS